MMTQAPLSRRAFIGISAAAAATALAWGRKPLVPVQWTGQVMGATASLTLYDRDTARAERVIRTCLDEVERLEQIFSLIRPDSDASRLNRLGRLAKASTDMLTLINAARSLSITSGGAFDLSVQPLWTLYSTHFDRFGPDADGPAPDAVAAAAALVGWQGVNVTGDNVALPRPGTGLTFNSIARGYATDRVGQILRDHGMDHVLIDLDNYLGLGPRPDGRAWALGIADPRSPKDVLQVLEVKDRAVASAGGYGTVFDRSGKFHHIFDPRSGACAAHWAGATVIGRTATAADALSTALLVVPPDQAARVLAEGGGETAYLVGFDGGITRVG